MLGKRLNLVHKPAVVDRLSLCNWESSATANLSHVVTGKTGTSTDMTGSTGTGMTGSTSTGMTGSTGTGMTGSSKASRWSGASGTGMTGSTGTGMTGSMGTGMTGSKGTGTAVWRDRQHWYYRRKNDRRYRTTGGRGDWAQE